MCCSPWGSQIQTRLRDWTTATYSFYTKNLQSYYYGSVFNSVSFSFIYCGDYIILIFHSINVVYYIQSLSMLNHPWNSGVNSPSPWCIIFLMYCWIQFTSNIFLLLFYFIFLLYNTVLVLPYVNMNPPRVYISSHSWTPLPPPSAYHPSGLSQCTNPKHPVSCIEPRLAIHFLYDIIHVSMPFSQIIPPSPSPTESKSLLCTSASLLLC